MRCAVCDGKRGGCLACGDAGTFVLTSCPGAALPPEATEFLMYYDLAQNHHWPVGRGVHSETVAFFEGWRWLRSEELIWRREQEEQRARERR